MKRYMVFVYTTYDNPEPFACMEASFDDPSEALRFADNAREYDEEEPDCSTFADVFDRITGGFISSDASQEA